MRFVTSVIHKVKDFSEATEFFCSSLGFQIKEKTETWVLFDNGSLTIRLQKASNENDVSEELNLEIQTKQIEEDAIELLSIQGVTLVREKINITSTRVETLFACPYGLMLTLTRDFNEDELGVIPPLPVSLDWEADAIYCIQQILRVVPLSFRQVARTKITERAEMLAGEEGSITVNLDCSIRALADVTPAFQHPSLVEGLLDLGFETRDYFQMNNHA